MAYDVKYRCTQKTPSSLAGTTYIVEILKDGYSSSVTNVKGWGESGVFSLIYEKIDPRNPYKTPIQKGRLEFYLAASDNLTYDGQAILDEILAADENEYQMRLKINGSVFWTGYVLNDLMEYAEGNHSYEGKIVAKDLTRLSGIDFTLSTSREKIITTIADLLDDLSLGLDIYTYTSWINEDTTDTDDFLNQVYHEEEALRNYGRTGDESDEKITQEEALDRVLKNYGLILRQVDNSWRIYQLTELDDPTSVHEFKYNSSGVQQSTSSAKDITQSIDRSSRFILPSSMNQINQGIKRARVKFAHRTNISGIKFPEEVTTDSTTTTSVSFSQFFASDGNQTIELSFRAEAFFSAAPSNGLARVHIQAGSYWWNESNSAWEGSSVTNEYSLFDVIGSSRGPVSISTGTTPADADGTLTVTLVNGLDDNGAADETRYDNIEFQIGQQLAQSTSIDYQLTQSGGYSTVYKVDDTWFGDGPTNFALSALRHGSSDADTTSDSWQRRGSTSYRNFHENLLKEIVDLQRSATRNLQGNLLGEYNPANAISYDSSTFFFLGGTLHGKQNTWSAHFLEINVQTGSDTFQTLKKYSDVDTGGATGPSSPSSPGGGGGGGDVGELDDRYVLESDLFPNNNDQALGTDAEPTFDFITLGGTAGASDPKIQDAGGSDAITFDGSGNTTAEGTLDAVGLFTGQAGAVLEDDVKISAALPRLYLKETDTTDQDWRLQVSGGKFLISQVADNDTNISSALGIDAGTRDVDIADGGLLVGGTEVLDSSRNLTAVAGTFTGDVGIGTSTPDGELHVSDGTSDTSGVSRGLHITHSTYPRIVLENPSEPTGEKVWDIFADGGQLEFRVLNDTAGAVQVDDVLILDTGNGNVTIGAGLLTAEEGVAINNAGLSGYTALYANGTTGLNGLLTVHDDIDPNANYTSNIGSAAKKFLTAHIAELRAELMTIEERRVTTGGRFNVGIGNVLASDLSAGATSISVEYNNLNNGDIIHLEKVGQVEFISVDSAASGTGPYSYDITRNLDGTGANAWTAGDGIFNTGQSGSGFIDMYATTSLLTGVTTDGPTTAYMQRTGATYNDIDVRAASGNIKGWYGVGSDEFGFAAGKYDSGNGNYIILTDQQGDLQIDTWNLETTTLILESTTPKLAMGSAASSLGLSSTSDTGTFVNGSGHWRAGTTDGSGNISKGFKFDGSNAILKANNAEIDTNSGWFGASDILAYSASSVTLAAFTANSEYLTNGQTYIGENLSQFNASGSGNLLVGDFGTAGNNPRFQLRGGSGAGGATVWVDTNQMAANDSGSNRVLTIDLTGSDGHQIGGAYFDDVDLWLGNATKGSADILLDGTGTIELRTGGDIFVEGANFDVSIGNGRIAVQELASGDDVIQFGYGSTVTGYTNTDRAIQVIDSSDVVRALISDEWLAYRDSSGDTTFKASGTSVEIPGGLQVSTISGHPGGAVTAIGVSQINNVERLFVEEAGEPVGTPSSGWFIFADTDGDLKAKAANGTVRTIAVD